MPGENKMKELRSRRKDWYRVLAGCYAVNSNQYLQNRELALLREMEFGPILNSISSSLQNSALLLLISDFIQFRRE